MHRNRKAWPFGVLVSLSAALCLLAAGQTAAADPGPAGPRRAGAVSPAEGYEHLLNLAREAACRRVAQDIAARTAHRSPSIAVLPLEGDPAGVTRRLLTIALPREGLTVVLRDDLHQVMREHQFAAKFKDILRPETVRTLGHVLGADAVLFGSVSELGLLRGRGHVRLTLALADVETAVVVWGDSVTATSDDRPPAERSDPGGSFVGSVTERWPTALGVGTAVLVGALVAVWRRRRRRTRRDALGRALLGAVGSPPSPLTRLLDRARASLRRAQMHLAERGEIDQAAAVLDERVRVEQLVRTAEVARGRFEPAMLFGARPEPPENDASLAEILADDVVREASRVERDACECQGDLAPGLEAVRNACRRLAAAVGAP